MLSYLRSFPKNNQQPFKKQERGYEREITETSYE
jgi:hypothetical protein